MNRAQQLRVDRGLTLQAVSEATGVSRLAIRRVEDPTCEVETQAPTLKTLGDFYGVQPSSLRRPAVFEDAAA